MKEEVIEAVMKLKEELERKGEVNVIFITGSYITGYYTEYSDIDLFIVFSDDVNFSKIKGLKKVGKYVIEYYGMPLRKVLEEMEEEWEENYRVISRLILMGKVIYDKNGKAREVIEKAREYFSKPFKKYKKEKIEYFKYELWDLLTELKSSYKRNPLAFDLIYYNLISLTLGKYSKSIGFEILPDWKIDLYILDDNFRKNYLFQEFPDKEYLDLILKCLKARTKEDKLKMVEELVKHIWKKLGGFDEKEWEVIFK